MFTVLLVRNREKARFFLNEWGGCPNASDYDLLQTRLQMWSKPFEGIWSLTLRSEVYWTKGSQLSKRIGSSKIGMGHSGLGVIEAPFGIEYPWLTYSGLSLSLCFCIFIATFLPAWISRWPVLLRGTIWSLCDVSGVVVLPWQIALASTPPMRNQRIIQILNQSVV